jgi:hypothetical protein
VVGEGTVFSEKALTSFAKFVVHRNQFERKYRPTEENFDDEEEDNSTIVEESRSPAKKSLADFMPVKNLAKPKPAWNLPEARSGEEDLLISPDICIEKSLEDLNLLPTLPLNHPSIPNVLTRLRSEREALASFIGNIESIQVSEEIVSKLYDTFEKVSNFLDTYDAKIES